MHICKVNGVITDKLYEELGMCLKHAGSGKEGVMYREAMGPRFYDYDSSWFESPVVVSSPQ